MSASPPFTPSPDGAGPTHCVELTRVDVLPGEQAFVLQVAAADRTVQRLQLPRWAIYQLMRLLPQIDAAMASDPQSGPAAVAYPVDRWTFGDAGADGIAVTLVTDRRVETSFVFDYVAAAAFHFGLGDVLDRADGEDAMRATASPPAP